MILRRHGFRPWEKQPKIGGRFFKELESHAKMCPSEAEGQEVRGAEVEISMLFADVRGSSKLARQMPVHDLLVRLGVMQGEFHWHTHDEQDEFFFLLDGEFHIELEGHHTVKLTPRQAYLVPKGLRHRPVVPVRSAVLMIEKAGVLATGD